MTQSKTRTAAVITVSDRCSRGLQQDISGPAVAQVLESAGFQVTRAVIVPDDVEQIARAISTTAWDVDVVATTGGTGLSARDVTPEATRAVARRIIPGLSELMRAEGAKATPTAYLSRGVCATVAAGPRSALVLNLPGNPQGAAHSMEIVLPLLEHALDVLSGEGGHFTP